MNATAQAAPEFRVIPLEKISLGENYRHRHPPDWDAKLAELGESMKQNGQLEPVLVRPSKKKGAEFEIVFGERRHRGAKLAGLESLICIVRDVPDSQILELQIAENADREDPHPLDEADAFAALVKQGATPASIAAIRGRDVSYVAKRLALLQLCPEGRKAMDEGKVTLGVALLVARIPDKKLQAEALDAIEDESYRGALTVADASKLIEEHFMLRLEKAPFDTTDASLVPKAGACTVCPKRTGAQAALFDDVKSADLCTDPKCHASKVEALWQIRKKEAAKGGTQVVEGREADAARHVHGGGKFLSLQADVWIEGRKNTSIRKLLGKDLPPVALARSSTGEIFEVVPRADANKAIRAARNETDEKLSAREKSYDQREKARQAKQKLQRKAVRLAIEQAVAKAPYLDPDDALRLVVRAFAARAWNETQRSVLDRRGITAKGGQVETAIVKLAKDLPVREVAGLGFELAMLVGAPGVHGYAHGGTAGLFADCLKATKVNFAAIEKSVAKQAKEGKGKPKAALVHLYREHGTNGTACGARAGAKDGAGASKAVKSVTCENCRRVGPAVLAEAKTIKANRAKAKKPARKKARK